MTRKLPIAALAVVTDPAEFCAVLEAKARKYPRLSAVDERRVYRFSVNGGFHND